VRNWRKALRVTRTGNEGTVRLMLAAVEVWTAEEIALLGTTPDGDVARRIGRTANAVRLMGERLGIPRPVGGRWTAEAVALLGTLPDSEVARRLGRSLSSVTQKRCKLRIPPRKGT
jgi:hypothetical protein